MRKGSPKIASSKTLKKMQKWQTWFLCMFFLPRLFGLPGGIECSGCVYIRPSVDQVKIFVQGRISRPINGSKLMFHMRMFLCETSRNIQEPWPHDRYFTVHWLRTGQIFKVKIFVQGRISRPVNGKKLIFHTRMYLYETCRNIQEPWPRDLCFTVHWLQTLADFPWLRFLSSIGRFLSSTDFSKLIFY